LGVGFGVGEGDGVGDGDGVGPGVGNGVGVAVGAAPTNPLGADVTPSTPPSPAGRMISTPRSARSATSSTADSAWSARAPVRERRNRVDTGPGRIVLPRTLGGRTEFEGGRRSMPATRPPRARTPDTMMRFGWVGGRSPEVEPSASDQASVGTSSTPWETTAAAGAMPATAGAPATVRPADAAV
jgi:hypothetical protein